MIELGIIENAPVAREPFEFFAAGPVVGDADLDAVRHDFPDISKPGVYPLSALQFGPAFARLIADIQSPGLARVFGAKLGLDLTGLPMMITVRGHAQSKDGRIHTDTSDKVATGLLYLNERWDKGGGRLRMLRNDHDIEDYAAEVEPSGGMLAGFRVSDHSFHGHLPYVGQRRYVMFNWIKSEAALSRQLGRHKLSAKVKKLLPFFYKAH